jgi:hypothetical protein
MTCWATRSRCGTSTAENRLLMEFWLAASSSMLLLNGARVAAVLVSDVRI